MIVITIRHELNREFSWFVSSWGNRTGAHNDARLENERGQNAVIFDPGKTPNHLLLLLEGTVRVQQYQRMVAKLCSIVYESAKAAS